MEAINSGINGMKEIEMAKLIASCKALVVGLTKYESLRLLHFTLIQLIWS